MERFIKMKMCPFKKSVLFITVLLISAAAGCGTNEAAQAPNAALRETTEIRETVSEPETQLPEEDTMSIFKMYEKHGIKAGTCLAEAMVTGGSY